LLIALEIMPFGFEQTYDKFINVTGQFEELVDRRLRRVAMADRGL